MADGKQAGAIGRRGFVGYLGALGAGLALNAVGADSTAAAPAAVTSSKPGAMLFQMENANQAFVLPSPEWYGDSFVTSIIGSYLDPQTIDYTKKKALVVARGEIGAHVVRDSVNEIIIPQELFENCEIRTIVRKLEQASDVGDGISDGVSQHSQYELFMQFSGPQGSVGAFTFSIDPRDPSPPFEKIRTAKMELDGQVRFTDAFRMPDDFMNAIRSGDTGAALNVIRDNLTVAHNQGYRTKHGPIGTNPSDLNVQVSNTMAVGMMKAIQKEGYERIERSPLDPIFPQRSAGPLIP